MAKPTPLNRTRIVKKRTIKFPRFQSDRFKRVGASWRKPRGIDCRVRRKFRGSNRMPKIGYGSDKRTKYLLPNGFYKFLVHNVSDVDMLVMQNRKFCGEIAHGVSSWKRAEIVRRAEQLNVLITNAEARLVTESTE